jgi:hypothetical protein
MALTHYPKKKKKYNFFTEFFIFTKKTFFGFLKKYDDGDFGCGMDMFGAYIGRILLWFIELGICLAVDIFLIPFILLRKFGKHILNVVNAPK